MSSSCPHVPDASSVSPSTAADLESAAVADCAEDPAAVAHRMYVGDSWKAISRYRDILASRGIEWGLIGPREVDRLWERHILNSAAVAELVPLRASVADVGSGAGLPGIPLAILRSDLTIDLIEPLLRRSTFLTHTVDDLGITQRVTVRRVRAEAVQQTYDAVLSRALAPLDRLIRWCLPLMKPEGQLLAIKGASAADELDLHAPLIAAAGLAAEVLTVRAAPGVVATTTVVRLRLR